MSEVLQNQHTLPMNFNTTITYDLFPLHGGGVGKTKVFVENRIPLEVLQKVALTNFLSLHEPISCTLFGFKKTEKTEKDTFRLKF